MTELVLRTVIQAKAEECFRLSLSVDAHTASMGRSKERAVAGVTEGEMSLGDSVTWQAKHFGVPFRMTSVPALDRERDTDPNFRRRLRHFGGARRVAGTVGPREDQRSVGRLSLNAVQHRVIGVRTGARSRNQNAQAQSQELHAAPTLRADTAFPSPDIYGKAC